MHQDVTGAINVLTKADPHAKDELYQDFEFIDDVSGRVLDHELAVKARKLEMDFFRKMRVYDKVPRAVATRDGCRVNLHQMGGHQQGGTRRRQTTARDWWAAN